MVVDADPVNCLLISRIVGSKYPVLAACDMYSALKTARTAVPDCLVLGSSNSTELNTTLIIQAFLKEAALAAIPILVIQSSSATNAQQPYNVSEAQSRQIRIVACNNQERLGNIHAALSSLIGINHTLRTTLPLKRQRLFTSKKHLENEKAVRWTNTPKCTSPVLSQVSV